MDGDIIKLRKSLLLYRENTANLINNKTIPKTEIEAQSLENQLLIMRGLDCLLDEDVDGEKVYFICYRSNNVVGNIEIGGQGIIDCIDDIRKLEKGICENENLENCVITNWVLLSKRGKYERKKG